MKEKLVSFDTAKLAKEKGFNLEVDYYYNIFGGSPELHWCGNFIHKYNWNNPTEYVIRDTAPKNTISIGVSYSAPSQSLLRDWLWKEHQIFVGVIHTFTFHKDGFIAVVFIRQQGTTHEWYVKDSVSEDHHRTFEIGLKEALKRI